MNKSKFLKKSLAMLLSVLMIVAMIPLGASAADSDVTDLQAIFINGSTVSVANKVFKADITSTTGNTIEVRGLYTGEAAEIEKANGDTVDVTSEVTLNLTEYDKEGNTYTIPLTLTSADEEHSAPYTVQLTVVPTSTSTELATVKATKAFSAKINGRDINIQVPLGYKQLASDDLGDLELTTKDNATIDGASAVDGVYTITGYDDSTAVVVRSQSTGNTVRYNVRITEVPVLEEFKAGDVAAKINQDVANDNQKVSATYPSSVLEKPRTEYDPPAKSLATTFKVPAGTVVQMGTAAAVAGDLTTGVITSGKSYNYLDTAKAGQDPAVYAFPTDYVLKVTCKDVTVVYPIEFNTEADTQNSILSATVDGEAATVSGNKITSNVQNKATSTLEVVLVSSPAATIVLQTKEGDVIDTLNAPTVNADGNGVFTSSRATVDQLKAGVIVVVTSQAGKNKQYELKITAKGDVDTTELTSFALRIGTTTYTGTVNKSARTVAVTVPYLTTDAALAGAGVIATTNAYVKACTAEDGTTLATTGSTIGLNTVTLNTRGTTGTATGEIWAVSKNGSAPATKYTVTVNLETAKTGNTLSGLVATSAKDWKSLTNDNTYSGSIKTNADKTKSVTVKPAYSECNVAAPGQNLNLKSLTTANGGVAFIGTDSAITGAVPGQLDDYYITEGPAAPFVTMVNGEINGEYIWVLPEIEARKELNNAGDGNTSKGNSYEVIIEPQAAKTGVALSNIKLGTTTLGSSLTGTIPYSMTVEDGATPTEANTFYADDFNISTFATLGFNTRGTAATVIATLKKNGDADADGEPDATSSQTNAKFFFERQANNTVKVSCWYNGEASATEIEYMTVIAEDTDFEHHYPIGTIKYAQPNTAANITAFSVAGATGAIKNEGYDNWSIKVTVPMDTKLTNLVPTFTASAGATVAQQGAGQVKSGETAIDFSEPVVLIVTSEDGGKTNTYTVTVTAADGFSDVPTTAWYYNNVMAAYNAGIVLGNGNGTFSPNANVTRRDFAVMVYNMLGKPTPTTTTSFKDVRAEGYEVEAIAYLKEKDIVSGDGDTGNFRPTATITRQEAACILANAKNLTGTSETKFNDDAKIASWAKNAVYACRAAGVINGDKDTGNFRPTAAITRAEAATMVLQAASK